MNNILWRIADYVTFWSKAGNAHGLHSPYVFELYTETITAEKHFYNFDTISKLRNSLLINHDKVSILDLGATGNNSTRTSTISDITSKSACSSKKGELLFKLADNFQSNSILELGTNVGLSATYFAMARPNAKIHTIEGAPNLAEIASQNFQKLKLKNITQHIDSFENCLENALKSMQNVDLVYIDGNHKYEPTINYFNTILPFCNENTVLIFDDIHWSKEMLTAWNEIKNNNKVTLSIDLYHIGIIFFKKVNQKESFMLRF